MKNKEIQAKLMAGVLSVSMAASACPVMVMAADGAQVAADGTYTKTTRVARTEEDDADENEWDEYDVTVSVTVEDGIITDITVTPGSTYDATVNASYFNKAVTKSKGIKTKLEGQAATEDTINEWDLVSGATRTSEAVKAAVLDAIKEAPVQGEDGENGSDNETGSDNEPGSGSETEGGNEPGNGNETDSEGEAGSGDGENVGDPVETVTYVLMNIPYAEFYAADVNNDVPVDAFSSATLNKTRTESLAGGSYHVNSDGSDITGITFPVKVGEGVDLSAYRQVTDHDSVDITVTNRGTTTTTTYTGQDALFENESYAYYVLSEAPSYYKELNVDENGNLVFGETIGEVQVITGVNAELLTETTYGDYQLDLDGLDETIVAGTDTVYGVVISTEEGSDYGLRHLENIWRVSALSWSTGFTTSVHNCPTSSAHYEAMMGQTINKVTYYTSKGIFEIPVADIYVPVKFEHSVDVEDASIHAGSTTVAVPGLPEDYEAVYSVEGLDVSVENGTMTYTGAEKGQYTLKITDAIGVYADLSTTFELFTEDMPAAYDAEEKVLTAAEGFSEEAFNDFISNITFVSVNGAGYAASGRNSVMIINEDGTINTEAAPFAEGESFEIVVSSTGYTDLAFIYTTAEAPETDEPNTDEPSTDEPSTDEPGTNEPGTENPGSSDSGNNDQNNTNQNNTNQSNTTTSGSTTSTTTTTTTTSTSPKTGDMANIAELLGALFTSGGVAVLAKKRRKK